MTELSVLEVSLHHKPVGTLTHLPGDRNIFAFYEEYIADPFRPALSLSFKDIHGDLITEIKSVRTRLPPFFSNLLPEGHMRDYLASHARVSAEREFFLLAALGEDLPGALRIGPIEHLRQRHVDQSVEELIDDSDREGILRFSLAGLQLKFSAIWENHGGLTIPANGVGGSWIVKLSSAVFASVPQNEFTMMELARRIGIDVPETSLVPLSQIKGLPKDVEKVGTHAFVIKRFDRDPRGERVHMEDFAQVFGVYPEKKYRSASYRNIAEVIGAEIGQEAIVEFIRRFVFNALIGNGDMHIKNWSLIYPDQRKAQLAPAYDFVSTVPYLPEDNLALNFVDSKSFHSLTLNQFKRFAEKAKISEKLTIATVLETVDRFATVWKSCSDLPLDSDVEEAISKHIATLPIWQHH